jgi:hypothetical protein
MRYELRSMLLALLLASIWFRLHQTRSSGLWLLLVFCLVLPFLYVRRRLASTEVCSPIKDGWLVGAATGVAIGWYQLGRACWEAREMPWDHGFGFVLATCFGAVIGSPLGLVAAGVASWFRSTK